MAHIEFANVRIGFNTDDSLKNFLTEHTRLRLAGAGGMWLMGDKKAFWLPMTEVVTAVFDADLDHTILDVLIS